MITKNNIDKRIRPAAIFRYLILLFGLSIVIPSSLTAKSGPQSMLELRKIALNFINKQNRSKGETRIEFSRWDKRIKLTKCNSKNIEPFYPGKRHRLGNVSVGLRCNEKKTWIIYLRAHITQQLNIVHSKRFISRGSVISKDDLVIEKIEVSNNSTKYFHSPSEIVGQVAKRSIGIGKKISANSLKPAMIIKRGQEVMIIAKTAGILIRTKGKALSDGSKGQIVKVKNSRSKNV